jgi:hypothetical protein
VPLTALWNIEGVEKKLREARSCLNNTIERERMAFGDREQFDFSLSGFLNAAMSVRGAFRYEQDRKRNDAVKAWKKIGKRASRRSKQVSTTSCIRIELQKSTEAALVAARRRRKSRSGSAALIQTNRAPCTARDQLLPRQQPSTSQLTTSRSRAPSGRSRTPVASILHC